MRRQDGRSTAKNDANQSLGSLGGKSGSSSSGFMAPVENARIVLEVITIYGDTQTAREARELLRRVDRQKVGVLDLRVGELWLQVEDSAKIEIPSDEQKRIMNALEILREEGAEARRPGPRSRGNRYRLPVYLNASEEDALRGYCDRHSKDMAEVVREGLELLYSREAKHN